MSRLPSCGAANPCCRHRRPVRVCRSTHASTASAPLLHVSAGRLPWHGPPAALHAVPDQPRPAAAPLSVAERPPPGSCSSRPAAPAGSLALILLACIGCWVAAASVSAAAAWVLQSLGMMKVGGGSAAQAGGWTASGFGDDDIDPLPLGYEEVEEEEAEGGTTGSGQLPGSRAGAPGLYTPSVSATAVAAHRAAVALVLRRARFHGASAVFDDPPRSGGSPP